MQDFFKFNLWTPLLILFLPWKRPLWNRSLPIFSFLSQIFLQKGSWSQIFLQKGVWYKKICRKVCDLISFCIKFYLKSFVWFRIFLQKDVWFRIFLQKVLWYFYRKFKFFTFGLQYYLTFPFSPCLPKLVVLRNIHTAQ